MINKLQKLQQAADYFAEQAQQFKSVQELVIFGSVARGDSLPGDIDLALVLTNFGDLPQLARHARKMSGYYHAWEVFLFDTKMNYLGRICYRKTCPTKSVDCRSCGDIQYVRQLKGFKFSAKEFYASPFKILFSRNPNSYFITEREKRGIKEDNSYDEYEDLQLTCFECGEHFIFSAGEQKYYEKRGFHQPKHCENCRIKRDLMKIGITDIDLDDL